VHFRLADLHDSQALRVLGCIEMSWRVPLASGQIEEQGRHSDRVEELMFWPMFVSASGISFLLWLDFPHLTPLRTRSPVSTR
jgi:hypothetical protein